MLRSLSTLQFLTSAYVFWVNTVIPSSLNRVEATPPTLILESLQSTSLNLSWTPTSIVTLSNLRLELLRVYSGSWSRWNADSTFMDKSVIWNVQGLSPFTQYRFRVTSSDLDDGSATKPSVIITTRPRGRPSPPRIVAVNQINSLHINVTWLPPADPRNRIVAYKLQIHQQLPGKHESFNDLHVATQDVPALAGESPLHSLYHSYLTGPLKYSTAYNVSLNAVNVDGVAGEEAWKILVTSSNPTSSENAGKAILLLAEYKTLYRKVIDGADFFDVHQCVSSFDFEIVSVSGFISDGMAFVTDEIGAVFVVPDVLTFGCKDEYRKLRIRFLVRETDVDWLNLKLYVLSRNNKIFQCDLPSFENPEAKNCHDVQFGTVGKISHMKVDPYNGFVYWVEDHKRIRAGEIGTQNIWTLMKETRSESFRTFVMYPRDAIVVAPHLRENKLYSIDILSEQRNKKWIIHDDHRGRSVAYSDIQKLTRNGTWSLFWASSEGLNLETYDSQHGYSSAVIEYGLQLNDLMIFQPDEQPIPVPLNPITNLQAIFDIHRAIITWTKPAESNSLGIEAWRKWKYRLRIEFNNQSRSIQGIPCCQYQFYDIKPGILYTFSVQAYSDNMTEGIWSKSWTGMSFEEDRKLFWSSQTAIHDSDLLGRSKILGLFNNKSKIIQLSSTPSSDIFALRQDGTITKFIQDNLKSDIPFDFKASSLCFEPYGNRIYISIPHRQTIARFHNVNSLEILRTDATAKNLIVDSQLAQMCWIPYTDRDIRCSSLNGLDAFQTIFEFQSWSDKRILSQTIDTQKHNLYFMTYIGSSLEYRLYMISLVNSDTSAELVKSFNSFEEQFIGPMVFLPQEKLIWISNATQLSLYEISGQSSAKLVLSIDDKVTSITVRDGKYSVPLPQVQPPEIKSESLTVKGSRREFSIFWRYDSSHVLDVDMDYVVSLNGKVFETREPFIQVNDMEAVNFTIYTRTKWAFSKSLITVVSAPESEPEPPIGVRAFLFDGVAIIRWKAPNQPNGIITHYEVTTKPNGLKSHQVRHGTEMKLHGTLLHNVEVKAVNGYGESQPSLAQIYKFEVPKLLIQTRKMRFQILDVDNEQVSELFPTEVKSEFVDYFNEDEIVFVIDRIIYYQIGKFDRRIVTVVDDEIRFLILDWIGRFVIWSTDFRNLYKTSVDKERDDSVFEMYKSQVNIIKIVMGAKGSLFFLTEERRVIYKLQGTSEIQLESTSCHDNIITDFSLTLNEEPVLILNNSVIARNSCQLVESSLKKIHSFVHSISNHQEYWTDGDQIFGTSLSAPLLKDIVLIRSYIPLTRQYILKTEFQECLTPRMGKVKVKAVFATIIRFLLPESGAHCATYGLAPTSHYELIINPVDGASPSKTITYINTADSLDRIIDIDSLNPFTNYSVTVKISNYYGFIINDPIYVRTDEGPPSAPRNISVKCLTPDQIAVSWLPPLHVNGEMVRYQIHYSTSTEFDVQIRHFSPSTRSLEGYLTYFLKNLTPGSIYKLWIVAMTKSKAVTESSKLRIKIFDPPDLVYVVNKTARSIKFQWESPLEPQLIFHNILLYPRNRQEEKILLPPLPQRTQPSQKYFHETSGLWPGTDYVIKLKLEYGEVDAYQNSDKIIKTSLTNFLWPPDDVTQTVTTIPDIPLAPGPPYIKENLNEVIITWNEKDKNVQMYQLLAKEVSSNNLTSVEEWTTVYSDSNNFWPISALTFENYIFKVRAKNQMGWSEFSPPSREINVVARLQASLPVNTALIGGSICGFVALCLIAFVLALTLSKSPPWKDLNPRKENVPNMELATLSQLPIHNGTVNTNNPLYNLVEGFMDGGDLTSITQFHRTQITFGKRLGSGAFGTVYDGILKDEFGECPVAIKTLQSDVKDNTKREFLKEAFVMAKLKHENILRLIGACLDSDPILILELMESDLLEFLRANRPKSGTRSSLSLGDLVDICKDVGEGCAYLAQRRHVHRDIAARNCLISSSNPSKRMVKIGDFGMARDIYKDDYYQKGGLMPVRWMAPESISDGVYTHQTDVWAFGVLLWEIITLGKQPYPAMSHTEVFNYVRNRGHLARPEQCPHLLYELMVRCWSFEPENRPLFKDCVDVIKELLLYKEELNTVFFDAPGGSSRDFSWKTSGRSQATTLPIMSAGDDSTASMMTMTSTTTTTTTTMTGPKYLEILHDQFSSSSTEADEIPRPPSSGHGDPCKRPRLRSYENLRIHASPDESPS